MANARFEWDEEKDRKKAHNQAHSESPGNGHRLSMSSVSLKITIANLKAI